MSTDPQCTPSGPPPLQPIRDVLAQDSTKTSTPDTSGQWGDDVALSPLFMPRVTPIDPTEFDDEETSMRAVDDSAIAHYSEEDEIHMGKPKSKKKGPDCKKNQKKRKKKHDKKPLELDWLGALSTNKGLVREVSKRINALREDCALLDRVRNTKPTEYKSKELLRNRVDLGFKAIHPDFVRLIKTYNILEKDMNVEDVHKYSKILSTFISQKSFSSLEDMVGSAMVNLGDAKTTQFFIWKRDLRKCAWVNLAHLHSNLLSSHPCSSPGLNGEKTTMLMR